MKDKYENQLDKRDSRQSDGTDTLNTTFTRSSTNPYERNKCLFCQESATRRYPLHRVATQNAGRNLKYAIEQLENGSMRVQLNSAIDTEDAHALDVLYHKNCWTNVVSTIAAEVEFLSLLVRLLHDGNSMSMAMLENTFHEILISNVTTDTSYNRKKLKLLIPEEISEVEFSRPTHMNEAGLVSLKTTRDRVLAEAELHSRTSE